MLLKMKSFYAWWNRPNKSVAAEYIQAALVIIPIAFLIRSWGYGLYKVPSGSMETTLLIGESFISDKFTYAFIRNPVRGDIIAMNDPRFVYSKNKLKHWWQKYVWGPDNFTKRIVGVPGDHIQGIIEEGKPVVYINGKKIYEPYLNKHPLVYSNIYSHPRSYDVSVSASNQPFYRMDEWVVKSIQKNLISHGKAPMIVQNQPLSHLNDRGQSPDIFDFHLKSKAQGDDKDEYWMMGDNRLGSSDCRDWDKPVDGAYIHGKIVFRLFSVDSYASWMILDLLKNPFHFIKGIRWSRCLNFIHGQSAEFVAA